MQRFDPSADCPKCGSDNLTITHCDAQPERPNPFPGLMGAPDRLPASDERLAVECARCKYAWDALPLDAPRVDPPDCGCTDCLTGESRPARTNEEYEAAR